MATSKKELKRLSMRIAADILNIYCSDGQNILTNLDSQDIDTSDMTVEDVMYICDFMEKISDKIIAGKI